MSYVFDGANKIIELTTTASFSITNLYSTWKHWLTASDNSKYIQAFRSVAGDPIGGGQTIAPYIFLNTIDGWKIRPASVDHELKIAGNLFSEDSTISMFLPTTGSNAVNIVIERSSAALAMSAEETAGSVWEYSGEFTSGSFGYNVQRILYEMSFSYNKNKRGSIR